jgi:uncharacterized membrane protein YphA (DoxX/SURF4 family)
VLATALFIQGSYYLREPGASPAAWVAGLLSISSAALLFVGFLTPLAGAVVALCAISSVFSLIPACSRTLFESYVPAVFAITILVAVVILGPGAFSIDARMFGRREIIIPARSSPHR